MAGVLGFGNQGVHDAAQVTFPWIGCTAEQGAARPVQQAGALESGQRPDGGGRIAGHDPRRVAAHGRLEIGFGDEGVAGEGMFLPALQNELQAKVPVEGTLSAATRLGVQSTTTSTSPSRSRSSPVV